MSTSFAGSLSWHQARFNSSTWTRCTLSIEARPFDSGIFTRYAYNPAGQTTEVAREGRTTDYGYDGLGRRVTTTDSTGYGSDTTHTVFNGLTPAQSTTTGTGTTTLVRDALGNLAEHVTANGDATWDLLDRLGSTIAGSNGPSITQLSAYDDWGTQQFATTGWSAPENYTGETTDPTQGLNHYHARTYDPGTASWTTPDPWKGLLTEPQSLHRYAYAWNNPTSNVDTDGNRCASVNPSSDYLPLGCGAPPVQAHDNVTRPPTPPAPPAPAKPSPPAKPKAVGPTSQNDEQLRHAIEVASAVLNAFAVIASVIGTVFDIAGWVLLLTGVGAALTPLAFLIGKIAGAAGAVLGCISTLVDAAAGVFKRSAIGGCVLSILAAVIGLRLSAAKDLIRGLTRRETLNAVRVFEKIAAGVGVNFDLSGLLVTVVGWVADD